MSYNILIVDDSSTIRSMIIKTITIAGIKTREIFEAGNGREALECLKKNRIDIALVDLNMPIMTGHEMLDQMNKDGLLKKIPVIVVSTDCSTVRKNILKKMGVKKYIKKPFTPEMLSETIEGVLSAES